MPRRLSTCSFPACLVHLWCLPGCPNGPFLPPWCLLGASGCPISAFLPSWCLWCLPGCPISPFLLPWCLPGASQAVQLVLCPVGPFLPPWCLRGASQAGPAFPCLASCPKWSFPASLVPPWRLAGRRISPFLLPWCLPGASQAVQLVFSCLPGASLVPRRPSNWSESRLWTGAGFYLTFSATSMANGPVRGKSWGWPHGRLPVAQAGL